MSTLVDPDVRGAAVARNMIDHLVGPLAAGAVDTELAVSAGGVANVAWNAREPLLLVAPRAPLGATTLTVKATLPGPRTVELAFAPFTEAGAALPVYRPAVDPITRHAAPFSVKLSFTRSPASGPAPTLADVAPTFEVRVVEGVLGKLLYTLAAEKARLRREARRLQAFRSLGFARLDALDRIGGELGVPRFVESHDDAGGLVVLDRETDDDYRRRLRLFRPWLRATRARLLELLNGAGTGANTGLLSELGLAERFDLVEEDNPFAFAISLVAAGDATARARFLEFARAVHLIWPKTTTASNAAHGGRFLARSRAAHEDDLRNGLRNAFTFSGDAATDPALAPMLAVALIRAAACRAALGLAGSWELTRAQNADHGSRYELGLGANLVPFTGPELTAMRAKHATATSTDPEIRGLLATMQPVPVSDDPDGRWLLEPCGLRTVDRIDSTTLYLSHLPNEGLVVNGPSAVPARGFAKVVPGYFGERRFSGDLLLYDRDAGEARFLGFSYGQGVTSVLRDQTGWRKTWTEILCGRLALNASVNNGLLFYERDSGTVQAYGVGNGNITFTGQSTTRKTWASLVRAPIGRAYDAVFAYDRAAGEAEFLATDGRGALTRLGRTLTGLRQSWSEIVAGDFGGSGVLDLLFYDRRSGDAELATTDGYGALAPFADARWDDRWTHVVPGNFAPGSRTDLFLYDAKNGVAEFRSPDEHGSLVLLARHEGLRKNWTHVVAGDHGGGFYRLTFYDRVRGEAHLVATNGKGSLQQVRTYSGWRKADGTDFEARFEAPGEPGIDLVLAAGLSAAATAWTGTGNAAWSVRSASSSPKQQTLWGQAVAPNATARTAFAAAGLAAIEDPAALVAALGTMPAELIRTLDLPAPLATQILSGTAAGGTKLRELATTLRANDIAAAIPLRTSTGGLIVVVSVIGLPHVGANLTDQPSTGFRWYVVPIDGPGGQIRSVGSRTQFVPAGEGLSALVAVGYAHRGLTDPYEYRVELPTGALLDMRQYEFLMNLLDFARPVGVRVNTYSVRKEHVDLDGDGDADALDPNVSRTYRAFRRRRHLGETATTLDKEQA